MKCAEYDRLESEVQTVLQKLTEITRAQLESFQNRKRGEFMRVDKELEHVVGSTERAIGALRQHTAEHKCQPK